jgi:hypothetical protein
MKTAHVVVAAVALFVPFGCGKDSENDGANVTGGSAGSGGLTGGRGGVSGTTNRGGNAGRPATSGSGPTGCEGLSPKTGEDCDDPGIVCPSQLGSCVCQRQGRQWECFEIGGNEGGSANISQGGAGSEVGGAPGMAGEGGVSSGGEPSAGQGMGGAAGGASSAGAGGDG